MRRGFAVCVIVSVALLSLSAAIRAEEKITFQDTSAMNEVLFQHVGKNVFLLLSSGMEIQGKLEKVGAKVVHLSKVAGRDFYDAIIAVDRIEGFEVKVRP